MASRSMNYLRKNAKVVLVVMGIVCMITFVIGTALTDWAANAQRRSENPNPVVVTWTKGKVHADELFRLRYRHAKAYEFLAMVIQTAIQRGGKPMVNGRPVTMDRMQGFDVGIPADDSESSMIQTMVLASEADRMGVVVDQDAVKNYLRQISSPELREGDWADIARQVVSQDNRLDVSQLLEHVAYELKAQRVRMLALSGMYAQGVGPIIPPGQAFELFSRLNRRFAIEAYPIETSSFVSQVKGEPTQQELEKLFDEGKQRDPNPSIDEPGFRKPHKLAFKWLKVSFTPFLDEAKKQITDEQIQEAYDKDISQGLHKALELPPEKKEEEKSTEQPSAEKPAETDKPAETNKPDADKPAETPKDEPAKPAANAPESPKSEDKPAGKADEPQSGCGLTEEQQEGQPAEKKAPAQEAPAQPAPVLNPAGNSTPPAPSQEKPADAPKEPVAEAPATSEPAAPKEQKFKPLSEVRDEIQTRLAQPIAEEARKKAVAEITAAIDKYGKAFRRYESVKTVKKNADLKPPEKLDIVPLATQYGFPIGETPLVDRHEVASHEIGQKVQQFDMAAMQMGQFRMLSFADLAFDQDQPLFSPQEARSSEPDVSYIYFRTAEEKPADVTLKEVREDVVEFWKRRKAYDLALAEAKKLADKAKSATGLADVVPDSMKIVAPPPFAWMTTGGFGFGQPELSTVQGIELAGREFMESVFALKPNEAGAAPNQSHQKIYVVRVIEQEPDDERLRTQFLESGYNNMILMLAQAETMQTQFEWYRGIAEAYEVKWQRQPLDGQRM